jgi:hypothetical protein
LSCACSLHLSRQTFGEELLGGLHQQVPTTPQNARLFLRWCDSMRLGMLLVLSNESK